MAFESGACENIRQQLDSYLGGEISAEANETVSAHLSQCQGCANELETRRKLQVLLKGAVDRETVPPYLESKIRATLAGSRPERRWFWVWMPAYGVAAALTIAFFTGWIHLARPSDPRQLSAAAREQYIETLFGHVTAVVRVGLGNHLHCTYFSKVREGAAPLEEMVTQMGPEYAPLIPVVEEKITDDYVIATAHRCSYHGRQFVHMVLRSDDKLLSLIITKRQPGESFRDADLPAGQSAAGFPIYQAAAERFEIAGFEAGDHLAFVISDMPQQDVMAWANRLAPPVHSFLTADQG
jgi:Putative zinc-finger